MITFQNLFCVAVCVSCTIYFAQRPVLNVWEKISANMSSKRQRANIWARSALAFVWTWFWLLEKKKTHVLHQQYLKSISEDIASKLWHDMTKMTMTWQKYIWVWHDITWVWLDMTWQQCKDRTELDPGPIPSHPPPLLKSRISKYG